MSDLRQIDLSQFEELDRFIPIWALSSEAERSARRWRATPEEFREFYTATLPRLDDLLSFLDQFPIGNIPSEALPLYHLALAFAEVAPHCELYGDSNKVPNSFSADRFLASFGTVEDC